jgi:outer membrane lipoprotein-sorting protein
MKNSLSLPFLLLLALVLGCSSLREMARSAGNEAPNDAPAGEKPADDPEKASSFTPGSDAKADLEEMSRRFMDAAAFQAKMTGTGKAKMDAAVDFVAPDRFRISTNAMGGQYVEMVIVGDQTYMNMGGKWQKMPKTDLSSILGFRQAFTEEGMKWIKDVSYKGEETLEGKLVHIYTYRGKTPDGGSDFSSKLWIGKSDGLPIRITANYSKGDLKTMQIDYKYDARITIEAPM